MKSYYQFIKEQNKTEISIQDVYDTLKDIFDKDDILSTDSVYENSKLIISVNKLYTSDQIIIFTKFIFDVDEQKKYLISNKFKYLYEINCQFQEVSFDNINDLKNKINDIIDNNKFGIDLKILSNFIKKPELDINQWFYKNKIEKISITGFKYEPPIKNIPCKELSFEFSMTVNEQDEITLSIKKTDVNNFEIIFDIFNKKIKINKNDLNSLIDIIGKTINKRY